MIITEKIGYSYKDLTIVPAEISSIEHRSECNPYTHDSNLPIFTAPMCTVVNENNYGLWVTSGISAILPRTVPYMVRKQGMFDGKWVAFGKDEFKNAFVDFVPYECNGKVFNICLDNANGHMESIYALCEKAKKQAKKYKYTINIMVGNIANPETYRWICGKCEGKGYSIVDYVRVGIGSGKSCITSTQTSIHYPMATLVDECRKVKTDYEDSETGSYTFVPAIVADGGIRGYDDVITALALGADYVMVGSVFAALQESAAETVNIEGKTHKEFFGMSTRKAQRLINAAAQYPKDESDLKLKTSEGTVKYLEIGTSVSRWVRNFTDYLRSAMSYTDRRTLSEFIGNVDLIVNSINSQNAINR